MKEMGYMLPVERHNLHTYPDPVHVSHIMFAVSI